MDVTNNVIIIGVDPGINTGIVAIEVDRKANRWHLVGRFNMPDVSDGGGLMRLYTWLRSYIHNEHEFPIAAVGMEQMMAYMTSAQEKAEAQAAVRMAAYAEMVTLHTYAPTSVRSTVVGSGRAKESDVAKVTRQLLGVTRTKKGEAFNKHQQDALAVALCCAVREGILQSIEPQEVT